MKNLYNIKDKNGNHVCFQVASSEDQAVDFAKMYRHKKSKSAVLIREN